MTRAQRWPIIPTIIAVLAIATMIGLAVWQWQRKEQKEAAIARYASASNLPPVSYPLVPINDGSLLFRRSSVNCIKVTGWRAIAGKSASGKSGYAHLASCQTSGAEGPGAVIAAGWSTRPEAPSWNGGGIVTGIIAPDDKQIIKLVAAEAAAPGLEPLAKPSISSIPNNHLIYVIQWLFFAAAAAVIYVLAVKKRMREAKDSL
jgi:surfeit locus 1 family protein